MSGFRDILKLDIVAQLHVLSVDSEDFHAADLVRHANVDLSIETTSTSQGWVNRIGSISGADDDHLTSTLGTVHQGEQLGDNALFDLTLGLLSVGSNRIDFVDENNGW